MSRMVYCGDVAIGGGAPVSIQSMTNVDTRNTELLVRQISELADAGCQIVRCAIPDMEAAESFGRAKKLVKVPLVADIHFDYRLAIASIDAGADKIRINPGNIGSVDRVKAVVDKAKEHDIPIRVGVNSGSLQKDLIEKYGGVTADALAESGAAMLKYIEDLGYDRLVVSIKSSNVRMNYDAHLKLKELTDAPIHIGITESGTPRNGELKSAIGIGALLLAGIGDTMRVSLTDDPVKEVEAGRRLLDALGMSDSLISTVSCPTCGRTRINLIKLANDFDAIKDTIHPSRRVKVAIMGCAVNGPGEARECDIGIAGGDGEALLFKNGKPVKKISYDAVLQTLKEEIEKL